MYWGNIKLEIISGENVWLQDSLNKCEISLVPQDGAIQIVHTYQPSWGCSTFWHCSTVLRSPKFIPETTQSRLNKDNPPPHTHTKQQYLSLMFWIVNDLVLGCILSYSWSHTNCRLCVGQVYKEGTWGAENWHDLLAWLVGLFQELYLKSHC